MVHINREYDLLDTFTNNGSTHDKVKRAGETFVLKLHGASNFESLDKYSHIAYKMTIGRSSQSSSFQLANLPPTSAAAKQHACHTHIPVQEWMDNTLPPTEWGWRSRDGILGPVETDMPVAPDCLINIASCGCNSLLMAMLGELPIYDGEVQICGRIAYVPQESCVFQGSVRENIIFGDEFNEKRYSNVISACSLNKDILSFPHGDQSLIGERGILLSGGQKARLSLARAIYYDADIYILDDPFSSVDTKTGNHIFDNCIKRILKNKVTILATHHLQYAKYATKILYMKKGIEVFQRCFPEFRNDFFSVNHASTSAPSPDGDENIGCLIDEADDNRKLSEVWDRLVSKEESEENERREVGNINWKTYVKFLFAGGGTNGIIAVLILNILAETLTIYLDVWMTHWVDADTRFQDSIAYSPLNLVQINEKRNISNSFYYKYFSIFSISCIFLLASAAILNFMICTVSARNLHNKMLTALLRTPMKFFFQNSVGRILNRFTKDIGLMDSLLPIVFHETFTLGINIVIAIGFMGVFNYLIPDSCCNITASMLDTKSPVFNHFSLTLYGLTTIRSQNAEQNFIFITVSQIGFIISQSILLSMVVQYFIRLTSDLESSMVSVERVAEYGRLETETSEEYFEKFKMSNTWPRSGEIEIQNVSLKYSEEDNYVLKNINFKIKNSEKIGIVGRTGAGKSSLITALFRLSKPEGNIFIDGISTENISLQDLRNSISVIPQDPLLFNNTVRYNMDPFSCYSDKEIWKALEQVHLKETISNLPGSLHAFVTKIGSNLSVGQRQLMCLARALLKNNKIIVLDEATANVDFGTDALVQQTLRNLFKDCTILTIAHRLETIMKSDKIMVIDSGKILEFDDPKILLQNKDSRFYKMVNKMQCQ
ncbi:Multidrug resistance-associated protein 4 [Nymphon striatum]|nr:Multidrug resistance-associated protein 4 [Nymphon striatum]